MDEDEAFVFTVTDEGYAKRTPVADYRLQNRGGLGIRAMRLKDDRGGLVSAMVVAADDEVISFKASGQVIRSSVADVSPTGRDTMGVKFVGLRGNDTVVAVTRNPERPESEETETETADAPVAGDAVTLGNDQQAEENSSDD